MRWKFSIPLLSIIICNVMGSPKKYQMEEGGFSPSHRYYESDLPYQKPHKNQSAYVPQNPIAEPKKDSDRKESRFGAISYGGSGTGYGGTGVSYGTLKLDIGGVALGALIGLGAILIIPKIAQVFAGGHGGGYKRNLEDGMATVTNLLAKIDNSLAANDLDSTSCTQRIVCNVVNDAVRNENAGESSGIDEFVLSFLKNSLSSYILDGTAIKEAIESGRSQDVDKCATAYPKCPLNRDSIIKVIAGLIPEN